ncbi:MAG: pectin acetylesterase-family hydrolase [Halioglobus sp.]|nr:pectin acetylesterase-family hydrolase [Halioglobus sp.]
MEATRKTASAAAPHPRAVLRWIGMVALATLTACSDNDNNSDDSLNQPFAEILAQGVDRYLGVYTPMTSETSGNVVTHTFGAGDGPLCLDGTEYSMATRDAGSEDLIIFLQGGGARWSTFSAAYVSVTDPVVQLPPPRAGILDPDRADNPVRDWNLVFIPYCDGGLHSSDKDNDYDNDGIVESPQRGLHNLSASLDVAVTTFPNPRRILLTGNSGGGFGTTFALPLVRSLYPEVPIEIVNDSGIGVGKPGDGDFLMLLMDDWNQSAFIPQSCPDCLGPDGHLSNYLSWQLEQDPNTRRGYMSYSQDSTIATFFLGLDGPVFEAALTEELSQLEAAHPERVRSWVPDGVGHTFLLREPDKTAGGVPVMAWISAMLDGSEDWISISD